MEMVALLMAWPRKKQGRARSPVFGGILRRLFFVKGSVLGIEHSSPLGVQYGGANAVTVPFSRYRADGSVEFTSFTTDGIIDGVGSLAEVSE